MDYMQEILALSITAVGMICALTIYRLYRAVVETQRREDFITRAENLRHILNKMLQVAEQNENWDDIYLMRDEIHTALYNINQFCHRQSSRD